MTGAAGFIGYSVAKSLLEKNYSVRVIDNLSRGKKERLEELSQIGAEVLVGDVRDEKTLEAALDDADAVIHLAALISVEESFEKPRLYFDVNLGGTLKVVEMMTGLGLRKIIFSSTAAVYGNPLRVPVNEDHPLSPISPYASSKLCGEFVIKNLCENNSVEYVILRFFNVYGPGQDPKSPYSGVISRFTYNLLDDKPLVIYGDGGQTRDFVFIKDVVESVRLSLEKKASGVFNIGSGRETSIIELAKVLSDIIGKKPRIIYSHPRRGDVRRSVANISKAARVLGYHPKFSLEEGLREYVDFLRKNRKPF